MSLYFDEYGELEEMSLSEYIGGGWSVLDVARSLDDGIEYQILVSSHTGGLYYATF